MLMKILLGFAALLVVLVVVILLQPSKFHVERSVTVNAPPPAVHALVEDFHAWRSWSPYEKLDPDLKRTFAGPPRGVGAKYSWVGNGKAGEGRMTIEKSEPSEVSIKLEFLRPFEATNTATFSFVETAEGTKTTWAMDGTNGFLGKAFHLVMDMDALVGGDFERGLAAMKPRAESSPKPPVAAGP